MKSLTRTNPALKWVSFPLSTFQVRAIGTIQIIYSGELLVVGWWPIPHRLWLRLLTCWQEWGEAFAMHWDDPDQQGMPSYLKYITSPWNLPYYVLSVEKEWYHNLAYLLLRGEVDESWLRRLAEEEFHVLRLESDGSKDDCGSTHQKLVRFMPDSQPPPIVGRVHDNLGIWRMCGVTPFGNIFIMDITISSTVQILMIWCGINYMLAKIDCSSGVLKGKRRGHSECSRKTLSDPTALLIRQPIFEFGAEI